MQIIEQQRIGKRTQDDCEDGIVATPHFVAVIDGSTSKTDRRICPAMRNGRYAMELIADCIRGMRADLSLDEFCEEVTAQVRRAYRTALPGWSASSDPSNPSHPSTILPPHERLCASAAIYSHARRQIWLVGDCQCMVDGTPHDNPKPGEALMAAQRAKHFPHCRSTEGNMLDGTTIVHDYARDLILPSLIRSMEDQNKTYAVIDGYPIYSPGIKTIAVDHPGSEVVLATDGYPFLRPTLEASEAALATQLAQDPFCIHTFKATKGLMRGNRSFDDRAYVRFRD